jgi:hypothetical protein
MIIKYCIKCKEENPHYKGQRYCIECTKSYKEQRKEKYKNAHKAYMSNNKAKYMEHHCRYALKLVFEDLNSYGYVYRNLIRKRKYTETQDISYSYLIKNLISKLLPQETNKDVSKLNGLYKNTKLYFLKNHDIDDFQEKVCELLKKEGVEPSEDWLI